MSKRAKIVAGVAVLIVAVVVAAIVWWSLRDDGPEAVDLGAAVVELEAAARDDTGDSSSTEPGGGESVAPASEPAKDPGTASSATTGDVQSTGAGGGPETAAVDAEPGDGAAAPTLEPAEDALSGGVSSDPEAKPLGAEASGMAGVWTLVRAEDEDAAVGDRPVSFAGYRVKEVLAGGIGENTVVGRTAAVDGHIELVGTALVGATVEVEMATLRTDDSHRDSHMRQALNTTEFPVATFSLVEPVELTTASFDGEPFAGSAAGDLTIRGVTNRTVFDLQAQLVGDVVVVVGSSDVVFSDYGVTAPTSAVVVSVENHGVMEFQLYFAR